MNERLECPNCKQKIAAEAINIQHFIAKCGHCHHVFSFASSSTTNHVSQKPKVFLPEHFHELRLSYELSFHFHWRHLISWFLVFFGGFWNLIVGIFVVVALATEAYEMLLFLSLHLAVGLGLLYYFLLHITNKTYIVVDQRGVQVKHGPLPPIFIKNKHIDKHEIDQFYVTQYVSSRTNGRPNYRFGLYCIKNNRDVVKVLKGIPKYEEALYLEQEIEKFLNIEDRPVSDEFQS